MVTRPDYKILYHKFEVKPLKANEQAQIINFKMYKWPENMQATDLIHNDKKTNLFSENYRRNSANQDSSIP